MLCQGLRSALANTQNLRVLRTDLQRVVAHAQALFEIASHLATARLCEEFFQFQLPFQRLRGVLLHFESARKIRLKCQQLVGGGQDSQDV